MFNTVLDDFFDLALTNRKPYNFLQTYEFWEERDKVYEYAMDMPGIGKDDLSIEIRDNLLYIKAESKVKTKVRKYSKVLKLSEQAETESVEAEMKDGILTLAIPKVEKRAKLIQIK